LFRGICQDRSTRTRPFIVPDGASLTVARRDQARGRKARSPQPVGFRASGAPVRRRTAPIQAGEFMLKPGMSQSDILAAFQGDDVCVGS
jgi:UPF0755 protein